jgi:uncharacterized protein YneF (UPF0154 family)
MEESPKTFTLQESHKKILIGTGVVLLVVGLIVGLYFAFRKKEPKKNKDNIQIALDAIGYKKENYQSLAPASELEMCKFLTKMVWGDGEVSGMNVIYKEIMGTDMPKYDCNNGYGYVSKNYGNRLTDAVSKVLDDGKKGFKNLVAIYLVSVIGFFGIFAKISTSEVIRVNYNQKGEVETIEIKKLEFPRGMAPTELSNYFKNVSYNTPSKIIQSIDNFGGREFSTEEEKLKQKSIKLVNNEKINQLRSDNNPKMSIDTIAELIIYSLSKTVDPRL